MADTLTARQKYDLARRNQATMQQVNTLLVREANQVLSSASQFDQQQLGGFLRSVVPGLVDKYGNINAVAAMQYYDEQRLLWSKSHPAAWSNSPAGRKKISNAQTAAGQRFAAAKLKSQIYVAQMPKFDPVAKAEPIIGWGMSRFTDEGFEAMQTAVTNSMTRAVGSYNRDTMLYNAGLDDAVVSVQRVAEADACAFCSLMVLASGPQYYRGDTWRTADYAIDFHDHCHCSIETLYEGDKPIVPNYYDQMNEEYIAAAETGGTSNTKQLLAEWSKQTGRK